MDARREQWVQGENNRPFVYKTIGLLHREQWVYCSYCCPITRAISQDPQYSPTTVFSLFFAIFHMLYGMMLFFIYIPKNSSYNIEQINTSYKLFISRVLVVMSSVRLYTTAM